MDIPAQRVRETRSIRYHPTLWYFRLVFILSEAAKEVLIRESHICNINAPVTVCGNLHGQFKDLKEVFKVAGNLPDTNYIFLGDYIDKGKYSVEVLSLLLALKVRYPQRITILRGNHESRQISTVYGFYDECLTKYGSAQIWSSFCQVFDYLPLTAVIENELFCVHGGLSPSLDTLDQLLTLDRVKEIPHEGIVSDLVWTDPWDKPGWGLLNPRGCGYGFGKDITKTFLHKNSLHTILRGHEVKMEGFDWTHDETIATIFSASKYCDRIMNKGAICDVTENLQFNFLQYSDVPKMKAPGVVKRRQM